MPMHNFKQARNFATRAGTTVPTWLADKFDGSTTTPRPQARRSDRRGRPGAKARQARRRYLSFLHHERADLVFAIQPSPEDPSQWHRKPPDPMTAYGPRCSPKISAKRTALLAAARRTHSGARRRDGHHDPGHEYDEAAFRGSVCRLPSRRRRQQRPLDPDAAASDPGISTPTICARAPTSSPPTRSPRPRSRRPTATCRTSLRNSTATVQSSPAPPPSASAPKTANRVSLQALSPTTGRLRSRPTFQPRLSRRHLRRFAQVLWRTDQRPARRRRRYAAGRNHF
jgi:hypothetical protein